MALMDPSDDELDEILNGTKDGVDIFDMSNIEPAIQSQPPTKQKPAGEDALGIDEEIKVVKKRQPIPKLDEKLLLSDAGIPKLRKISKERLKLKGKGHEYGDIARMLNMYQLWLDDMYPRAKFADGLAMIEKLGHKKYLQIARKAWIDEGKPANKPDSEDDTDAHMEQAVHNVETMQGVETDGTARQQEIGRTNTTVRSPPLTREDPDEDELDALLAEEAPTASVSLPSRPVPAEEDMFADEMEAMADMDEMWN